MKHSPRLQPEQKQEFISLREQLGDTIKAVEEMWRIHPDLKIILSKPHAHDIWYKHKTGKLVLPKLSENQEELPLADATPTRIEPVQTFDVEVPGSSPDSLTKEERKELKERALEMRKKGLKWTVVHATLTKQYKGKKIPKLGSLMQFPSQERYKERQQQEPTQTAAVSSDVASPEIELPKRKNYMVLVATPSVTLTFEVTKEKLNNIISTVMED
jgi:hypothetical protein